MEYGPSQHQLVQSPHPCTAHCLPPPSRTANALPTAGRAPAASQSQYHGDGDPFSVFTSSFCASSKGVTFSLFARAFRADRSPAPAAMVLPRAIYPSIQAVISSPGQKYPFQQHAIPAPAAHGTQPEQLPAQLFCCRGPGQSGCPQMSTSLPAIRNEVFPACP